MTMTKTPTHERPVGSIQTVASRWGCHVNTVRNAIKSGRIPTSAFFRLNGNERGRLLFYLDAVAAVEQSWV